MLERTGVHAFQPATLVALWPRRLRRWSGWLGEGAAAGPEDVGGATQRERLGGPGLTPGAGERAATGGPHGLTPALALPRQGEQPEAVVAWQRQALAASLPDLEQRFGLYPLKPCPGGAEDWREVLPAFIQYLLRARAQEGVAAREALDAALLHLLMDLGARAEAAAFASLATGVPLDALDARLQVGEEWVCEKGRRGPSCQVSGVGWLPAGQGLPARLGCQHATHMHCAGAGLV